MRTGLGPVFSILSGDDAATQGGNGAQRREYDKKLGAGTMSRAGVTCLCCGLPWMSREDLRLEGDAGRLGKIMTAVVVDGVGGKEYRLQSMMRFDWRWRPRMKPRAFSPTFLLGFQMSQYLKVAAVLVVAHHSPYTCSG